jgi:uncharacterized protein (TIGR03437 family)
VRIVVEYDGASSDPVDINRYPYLPAIYCNPEPGSSPTRYSVTAVNPVTGEFVGSLSVDPRIARAAHAGETIDLYVLGLGSPLEVALPTDRFFTAPIALPLNFNVVVAGERLQPLYAGLISPGLYQVRVALPRTLTTGDQPIYIDFGSSQSAPYVFLKIE